MENFLLTFGDWSNDGHGKSVTILANGDYKCLKAAETAMYATYPNMKGEFCQDYEDSCPGESVWQALYDFGYSGARIAKMDDSSNWENMTFEEIWQYVRERNYKVAFDINFIIDAYLWIARHFGSRTNRIDVEEYGVSAGYGCLW